MAQPLLMPPLNQQVAGYHHQTAGTGQPIHPKVALLNADLHWVLSVREADGRKGG